MSFPGSSMKFGGQPLQPGGSGNGGINSLLQGIMSLFGGGGDKKGGVPGYNNVSTFNPQQQQAFGQSLSGLSGLGDQSTNYYSQLLNGSPEAFKAFEAPYMRQFHEQTVPDLARQFGGLGAGSSSGFQQALGQAGAGLSENLAALRSGLQSNAAQQGQGALQNLLGMNTQAYLPEQLGFLKQLLVALGGGAGQVGGAYALSKFLAPAAGAASGLPIP